MGLKDKVGFRVADAQKLPFDDSVFDAVITELVTSFPTDKLKAVNEYARVTKPGGFVGLNESTWLKYPPTPEITAWVSQDLGTTAKPLQESKWIALIEFTGLVDTVVKTFDINVKDELKGFFERYGCGGMLSIYGKMLVLYCKNPAYREFLRETLERWLIPKDLDEYFGYGLYIGRKPG